MWGFGLVVVTLGLLFARQLSLRLVRRARFLLIVLIVLFAFFTPGEALLSALGQAGPVDASALLAEVTALMQPAFAAGRLTLTSGGGVAGTVELLACSLRTGGIILVGEPYWRQLPPTESVAKGCLAHAIADFLMLPELLASFGRLGYDVVEMVLADQDGWDRYEAAKWLTMRRWLEANPDDELAGEVRVQLSSEPERYAAYTREYLGWGVFALMPRGE